MTATKQSSHRTGNRLLYLGFLPVALSVILIVIFRLFPPSEAVFEPGYLLAALNSIFLSLIPFIVAYLSGQSYLKTGSPNMFLIGCALFVFGAGNLVAGWTIEYSGPNTTVTIHNIVCFVASIFYILASLIMVGGIRTEFTALRRIQKLVFAFSILLVFVGFTSIATIAGLMPPFFIVGTGPTTLRIIILTAAIVLHTLSAIIILQQYWRQQSPFLFWYGLALLLIAAGLTAVLIQPSVGSPIGWVGRISQYLGGTYFLASVIIALHEARTAGTNTGEILASFFRDSAIHYVKLMETAKDPIVLTDSRGQIYLWNPAAEKVFGFNQKEAIGSCLTDLIESHNLLEILLQKDSVEHPWTETEMPLKRKNGSIFFSEISAWTTEATDKKIATFIIRDITERKTMEKMILESEEKYRRLFTEAGLGIFHSTFDDRFIDLNPALAKMLGYESPEDVMKSIHSISQQIYVDPPRRDLILENILKEGKTVTTENRYYRKSGEEWPARLHVRQVSDETGKPLYLEGFVEDITDRKKMEKKLLEQEHFLSSVVNTSPAIVYVYDLETRSNIYTNDGIGKILGYMPAEAQAMGVELFTRLIHPEDLQSVIEFQSKIQYTADDEMQEHEHRVRHADGSWRVLRTRERPFLRNADGVVKQKIGIAVDVTEHKQMEEELRRSRDELEERVKERTAEVARLAAVVQHTRNGIVLTKGFNILFVNNAFCQLTGYSEQELLGRDLSMLSSAEIPIEYYEQGGQNVITNSGGMRLWTVQRKDGIIIHLETSLSTISGDSIMAFICQDITEKMQLEEQLRQSQKMEAIGTLAGGIAHDFNNILAAIIGFTEMAIEDVPDRQPVGKNLQNVMTSAIRARELVKQILAFSRKTSYERAAVSLSPVVRETVNLLRASIPASVDMTLSITASPDTVVAAPVEIQQIIMNLATNALLAMQDQR
ncbi:MAG: signal transduction histidine kinase, partial [Deltaproteobacteria bacterium]|nr:signal transduction histidine kinase [Deltaproteobacteria bacterium]